MLPIYRISLPERRDGRYVFKVADQEGREELVACPPSFSRYRAEVHRQLTRQYLARLGDVEMEGRISFLGTILRLAAGVALGTGLFVVLLLALLFLA